MSAQCKTRHCGNHEKGGASRTTIDKSDTQTETHNMKM